MRAKGKCRRDGGPGFRSRRTGAALGLTLLEAAVRAYREMATFGEAGVADQDA